MADTTWGVKVTEELKERMSKAQQDSNLTGKEFIEVLLQSHQTSQIKDTQPMLKPDIDELQMITNRMNAIYVNIIDRINSILKDKAIEFSNQLDAKDRMVKALQDKNSELEENCILLQKEHGDLIAQNDEQQKNVLQIEEVAMTNKELVSEFKEKNEFLTGLLNEYKQFKDMVNRLNAELETERQQTRAIVEALQESKKESDNLNKAIIDMEAGFKTETEQLHMKYRLEIDKDTLEIRTEYQQKHEQAATEYQNTMAKLQEEHNCRIKLLLDRIDAMHNSRNSPQGFRKSNAVTE